ncbi:WxL domain-containing protein [Lacticaseibacillus daqingensis]|uniref:WxL domain-containing protein n=1 Tax=Lacticaseibacillus daqingensis TaxID=2486014 RepID=UPI000F7A09F1|nr:WxL domain-containing protein [Lacticaseibacillus daqingensis]
MTRQTLLLALAIAGATLTATQLTPVAAALTDNSQAVVKIEDATPKDGGLTLDKVPALDYGTVTAGKIYNGFNQTGSASGDLAITDARPFDYTNGWTLTLALGQFKDASGAALETSTLSLSGTANQAHFSLDGQVATDDTATIITSDASKRGTQILNGAQIATSLKQTASQVKVVNNTVFTAPLTWTLAATADKFASL